MRRAVPLIASLIAIWLSADRLLAGDDKPAFAGYRRESLRLANMSGEPDERQLDVWYPTTESEQPFDYRFQAGFVAKDAPVAGGRHPLLVFSHGYRGASDQSIFIMEACARAGYVVASLNHADAIAEFGGRREDPPRFRDFDSWTDEKYRDRKRDIGSLLDEMLLRNGDAKSPWHKRINASEIGGMGHSLGGYTMLGLAGGWKTWKEPRIKTVVAFSPYVQPFTSNGDLPGIDVPIMVQGGTFDLGVTPFLPPAYEKLKCPKAEIVLRAENHFGWTNLATLRTTTTEAAAHGNPELIVQYAIAFFDEHLRGLDRSEVTGRLKGRLFAYRSDNGR